MDNVLIEGARSLYADNLYDVIRTAYNSANYDYLQRQIDICAEFLTDEQKQVIRETGVFKI